MKRLLLVLVFLCRLSAPAFGSGSIVDATSILERWTAFHWGRDCLVWLVHYPEELVDPWVAAEAARSGMSEAERNQYRASFTSELRIADTEPFLLTVYVFGPRPLDLGSFATAVQLESNDGKKFPPLSYERKFDQPLSGIVQGLVFFPKQVDKAFSVIIRNLGIHEEQRFSFDRAEGPLVAAAEPEVVVVELPPAPKKEPVKPQPPKGEKPAPTPPPPPPVATPQELAELKPEPVVVDLPVPEKEKPVLYISKEKTVETFIRYWIEGRASAMYDLLSASSRTALSEEQFARQVEATGLRNSLREGYKIQWMDDSRARIVTAQRMLLFRTLRSKVLTMDREETIWRVSW